MKLLLDTHALIWFAQNDANLPTVTKQLIEDAHNERFVSMVTFWEMSIKMTLGKLQLAMSLQDFHDLTTANAIETMPILFSHVDYLPKLPLHHQDPFDRLIIAQATVEQCHIVSRDANFPLYTPHVIWNLP
ncbi:MAG: type II toxin-antitoxin system VapC family toxin [Bacteroidetes bacterium]|nr:MAG: type II toxin-antitoxin system VapC family toxin [Bacteroidota bacterium]